ncbi:MAG TPA: ABC transporter permease [Chloroflexota bacterium]|nr:ABC transporter permease [Chloroflexota bacterium]
MTNTLAIARRELLSYYSTFMFYAITAAFLVVTGLLFVLIVPMGRSANLSPLFQTTDTLLLLCAPFLTMRLLSEEFRSGSIELIMTSPVRDSELILGKFLAGFGLVASMLLLTGLYPILVALFGSPDRAVIIGGYVGAVLFGGMAVSIGLFTSSLTSNQIVAAFLSFAIFIVLWVIDGLGGLASGDVAALVSYLSVFAHIGDMARGIIDTKDVLYFVSVIAGALFLASRSIESRRWR